MKNREIGTKRNKLGISVVVLDLKTRQSSEYLSISEAARSLNTHPKTIWRIVFNNKLYLNRYQITEKSNKEEELLILWFNKYIIRYFDYILNIIRHNKVFIYRIFFYIVLIIIIIIFIAFIFLVCKDIYDEYVFTLHKGNVNYNNCVWEHKLYLNNVLNNTDIIKYKWHFYNKFKYDYFSYNNITPLYQTSNKAGIYQTIIKEINLDFSTKGTVTFSHINSYHSSPIIERVNINAIFNNAIASLNTSNDLTNSLGIQGLNLPRNSILFDDLSINTRIKTTELLNYQSNILYCLINGLSPSLY